MNNMNEIVGNYAKNDKNITLKDFILKIKSITFTDVEFWFIDYFLSLTKNETMYEFIIDQEELINYGIALSKKTDDIKKRLENLFLENGKHYKSFKTKKELTGKNGCNSFGKTIYKLTPYAFKLCLMRAKKIKKEQ